MQWIVKLLLKFDTGTRMLLALISSTMPRWILEYSQQTNKLVVMSPRGGMFLEDICLKCDLEMAGRSYGTTTESEKPRAFVQLAFSYDLVSISGKYKHLAF